METAVEYLINIIYQTDWINYTREERLEVFKQAKELEKQQKDDCAIEFAEWNEKYPPHLKYDEKGKYLGLQKLIIVFKKEKGL